MRHVFSRRSVLQLLVKLKSSVKRGFTNKMSGLALLICKDRLGQLNSERFEARRL